MAELILENAGRAVLRCPLHGQRLTVGRSAVNDISLPDDGLPPHLCTFEPGEGRGYRVVALGGVPLQVNGADHDELDLSDGDLVALGELTGRFVQSRRATEDGRPPSQRTGLLRTKGRGKLTRTDLRLRLPDELGGGVRSVPADGLRFGADQDNDVVIDDGFVSSFHAQVYLRGERLYVRDLDSTNGTFVSGVKVIEAEVPLGAKLTLGKAELRVEGVDEEEPVTASGDGPWSCGELRTADESFAEVFALIEKVAPHDATVAVFGETGTGKELVARAVHDLSGRAKGPFVPLNCAAIPSTLIESLVFGHEKGAFTGADRVHRGVFEEAHEGTLFLDEIGELPLELQAKLLRVLETRTVRRVGGARDLTVDVRVVCATHRDLMQHVEEGKFREDLLHRLYIIPIQIPPLRGRPADIAFLARHFAEALSPDDQAPSFSDEALQKLDQHTWAGNVRELRNVVQRALILRTGSVIDATALQFLPSRLSDVQEAGRIFKKGMTLDDIERQAFKEALEAFGSVSEAARALHMPKTTFWRRAIALGVLKKEDKAE